MSLSLRSLSHDHLTVRRIQHNQQNHLRNSALSVDKQCYPFLRKPTRRSQITRALFIDRRRHLELAWQRQQQEETAYDNLVNTCTSTSSGSVIEVKNLPQLEKLLEASGNGVVLVCFYSRSCGTCKQILEDYNTMRQQAIWQKARVVFAKHNIVNEYDEPSDVSRFHQIKVVPTFLFYVGGALVRRVTARDIRILNGSAAQIQQAMLDDVKKLHTTYQEVLLRTAPSARP